MADGDYRLFAALRFSFSSKDFLATREELEHASWAVVDVFRASGFYALASTYPGWTESRDMGDFGPIHPLFPVNGIDFLCKQIQPSPIYGAFSDPGVLGDNSGPCKDLLVRHGAAAPGEHGLSAAIKDGRWRSCIDAFRAASIISVLNRALATPGLAEAAVVFTEGGMPGHPWSGEIEECLFRFWLNLFTEPPENVGFKIGSISPNR